jgi:hypothetical protein
MLDADDWVGNDTTFGIAECNQAAAVAAGEVQQHLLLTL